MEIFGNISKSCFKGLMRLEARMVGKELSGCQNGDSIDNSSLSKSL